MLTMELNSLNLPLGFWRRSLEASFEVTADSIQIRTSHLSAQTI